MSGQPIDVLVWISERVAAHEALSESDAYHAQELPRAQAVNAAVVELIAAVDAVLAAPAVSSTEIKALIRLIHARARLTGAQG